ncbi:hypothetical protein NHX12_007724 [Muraenolepis orangiensis]|uniref:Uncharacterized protein n=1 Tax=Muraenolepis orangiensis TaxID=630683 RepID=A0A9Q0DQK9_9TELE|nr:hypothetical protein NHX12_007724 [Muraenolepis orangiensis]
MKEASRRNESERVCCSKAPQMSQGPDLMEAEWAAVEQQRGEGERDTGRTLLTPPPSTMNLAGLPRRDPCLLDNPPRKKGHLWSWRSLKGKDEGGPNPGTSTLPRGWKHQRLREKQEEFHTLVIQEERLAGGEAPCPASHTHTHTHTHTAQPPFSDTSP